MFRIPQLEYSELSIMEEPTLSGRFGNLFQCTKIGQQQKFVAKFAKQFKNPLQGSELLVNAELRRSKVHDLHCVAEFYAFVSHQVTLIGFPTFLGNVRNFVQTLPDKRITEKEGIFMWLQLANALNYLHVVNGFVHSDVQPVHMLVRQDGNVALCDFSSALKIESDGRFIIPMKRGSAKYEHPALQLRQGEYTDGRVDFWSLMLAIYRLVSGVEADEFEVDSEEDYDFVKRRGPLYREHVSLEFRFWVHQYIVDSDEDFRHIYHATLETAVRLPPVAGVDVCSMYHGACSAFAERMLLSLPQHG
ncbi:Serine/threonine-protein kinase CHK1 [Halotydeus destructor]|nr:Serine/threonine-protein kinase CHK1 [Halotydeus destructor]